MKKFTPGEQAIADGLFHWCIEVCDAYASVDFKEFTHIY